MTHIKGYEKAQREWENRNDQMDCGCAPGFCDCEEEGENDGKEN